MSAQDPQSGAGQQPPPMSKSEMISQLYHGACDMFIRPARVKYDISALGKDTFQIGPVACHRKDLKLKNARGQTLECSHFQRISPLSEMRSLYPVSVDPIISHSSPESLVLSEPPLQDPPPEPEASTSSSSSSSSGAEPVLHKPIPSFAEDKRPCVIYLHGNSGCRLDGFDALNLALSSGCDLFTLDFSGSGLSEGDYVTLGFYEQEDVKAVVSYLNTVENISTIALWGRSMGAATSILHTAKETLALQQTILQSQSSSSFQHLMNQLPVTCCILDSPFTDLMQLSNEVVNAFKIGIPSWMISTAVWTGMIFIRKTIREKAGFDLKEVSPIELVQHCKCPSIFIHGEGDDFVSPDHAKNLFDKHGASVKKLMLPKGDHNSLRPPEVFDAVSSFLFDNFLPHNIKEIIIEPPRLFGRRCKTTQPWFFVRQIQDAAGDASNTVIVLEDDKIALYTPFFEEPREEIQYHSIVFSAVSEDQFLVFQCITRRGLMGRVIFYSQFQAAEIGAILDEKFARMRGAQ